MATTAMKAMLLSALVVVLLWRAAAVDREASPFGLRAKVDSSRVELTLTLPGICVRLNAHVVDQLLAVSATRRCSRCESPAARRSWS